MIATDWIVHLNEKYKKNESFECMPFRQNESILPRHGLVVYIIIYINNLYADLFI